MNSTKGHQKRLRTKPIVVIISIAIIIVCGIYVIYKFAVAQSAPRFTPGAQVLNGKVFQYIGSRNLGSRLNDDKLMIVGPEESTTSSYNQYLLNVETGEVLGELDRRAYYVSFTPRGDAILAITSDYDRWNIVPQRIKQWLMRVSNNSNQIQKSTHDFWLVPLDGSSPNHIAKVNLEFNPSSDWHGPLPSPSPNRRYCIITLGDGTNFILDVEEQRRIKLPYTPNPRNIWWWSDREILLRTPDGDLQIMELESRRTSALMTSEDIKAFFEREGLPTKTVRGMKPSVMDYHYNNNDFYYHISSLWNGRDYSFYMGNYIFPSWPDFKIHIVQLDKDTKSLKVAHRNFVQMRNDNWDRTHTLYVYDGDYRDKSINQVCVLDTKTSMTTPLIANDPSNMIYSYPIFFDKWIIMGSKNILYRINYDGSDMRQIFPPASN